jgi:hypothetical protein
MLHHQTLHGTTRYRTTPPAELTQLRRTLYPLYTRLLPFSRWWHGAPSSRCRTMSGLHSNVLTTPPHKLSAITRPVGLASERPLFLATAPQINVPYHNGTPASPLNNAAQPGRSSTPQRAPTEGSLGSRKAVASAPECSARSRPVESPTAKSRLVKRSGDDS